MMNPQIDAIESVGLRFFGKISASISHELKNCLAVINESAGLMDDLAQMADQGVDISPEKLKATSAKIVKQIHRADEIIKNMNRFSHSVDDPVKQVSVDEMVELVAAVSKRFASNRGLMIDVAPDNHPIIVSTHPYYLLMLMFHILEILFMAQGKGKTVRIVLQQTDNRKQIRMSRPESIVNLAAFPTETEKRLADRLNVKLDFDAPTETFVIGWL